MNKTNTKWCPALLSSEKCKLKLLTKKVHFVISCVGKSGIVMSSQTQLIGNKYSQLERNLAVSTKMHILWLRDTTSMNLSTFTITTIY